MNRKLQIVSGKGGVGKSMVAAALAQKQAAQGYNTLLEEVPTREAYELFQFAKETAEVACDRLIVNRFIPARFTNQELQNLKQWACADQAAAPLYDAARYETSIARTQATQLEWLCSKQLPVMTLPEITTESDDRLELVHELVQHLDLAHE